MIRSMTAFARFDPQESWGQLCWEVRSVNHRYLDISIRLPEDFRSLEMTIREYIQKHLKRGKIECNLYFQSNKNNTAQWQINQDIAQQVWEGIQQINAMTGNSTPPNPIDILRWQGVVETKRLDVDAISETVLEHFEITLTQLVAQREREGAQLAALIEQRCIAIDIKIKEVRQNLPLILQAQREKFETRLAELVEINSERLEQEMLIVAQKMDIAEELDRMDTHLLEIRETLKKDEAIGRRLDFLVQELHREANTLGSKSNHIHTSSCAVEMKVLIEQMREQTQNLE